MFRRWELPVPTTVAPLFAPEERRGIYVLEFANGERYVGQAEDVVSRYNSHRRGSTHHEPWLDVVAIGFLSIPDGDLNGPERETIREHRGHFPLRNRTYNFGHWQPSPLDEIINPETQRHWATGQTDYDLQPFRAATKTLTPGTPKLLTKASGQETLPDGRSAWEAVVDELAQVVALVIPNATETEGRFWSISDYPSTAGGRFATLNVGTTELIFFPRRRFQPDIGSLAASAGLVSILNADIETFVDPEDLPSYLRRVEDGVVSSYEVDGHAVEFIRQLNAYSTPADRGQMPLGVFGVRALDSTELAGIRSFATHAMRQASARVNTRSRSESLTRMVYEHIATPDFQADLVNN